MSGRAACALALLLACKPDVDFSQGRPYLCDSDSQCGSGWRCGLEGVCHQTGTPGTYRCDRDAGACEAGWACGVDGFCIDPDDAGNNACASDSDCFHGLRCDSDGRCVDPRAELLSPNDSPPGLLTVLSPKLLPQGPTGAAVAYAVERRSGNPTADAQRRSRLVFADHGQVLVLLSNPPGLLVVLDAGYYPSGISAVAVNDFVEWTMADGGLYALGTVATNPLKTPTPVHDATAGGQLSQDWDIRTAFHDNFGLVALARDGGADFHLVSGANGGVVRKGPTAERPELIGLGACLLAGTPSALWSADPGAGTDASIWGALALPELDNDRTAGGDPKPARLRAATPNLLAVALDLDTLPQQLPDDAGAAQALPTKSDVALYDVGNLLQPGFAADGGPPACAPATGLNGHDTRVKLLLGPCNACEFSSEVLLDFHPLVQDQQYAVQTNCFTNGNLRTYVLTETLDGQCVRTRTSATDPQFQGPYPPYFGGTNPFGVALAGSHGELWAGDNLITAQPVFLDRPAQGLYAPRTSGGALGTLHAFADEYVEQLSDIGFQVVDAGQPAIACAVVGTTDQVVTLDGRVVQLREGGFLTPVATVKAPPDTFLPPFFARAVPRADGATEYVLRSFDTLYSGHAPPGATTGFQLKLQVVPAPGTPLTGSAFWAPDGADAGQLVGYVLSPGGLFEVSQASDNSWDSAPVATPPGPRATVFSDGKAGRLAYQDGRLFTLPSRVQLAPGLPGVQFNGFLHACGETWGLTADDGLVRLHPVDGGTGVWVNEPLDSADAYNFSPAALSGGKLIAFNNQIYVFNGTGGALTFVPAQGCGSSPDAGP
jgi:hypothetical protein